MIDYLMPETIFERVMNNEKITKKFWGFFWREMLVYMALVFLIIAILLLTVKGITNTPLLNAALAVLVMIIPCVVMPIIHFKQLHRTIDKEDK